MATIIGEAKHARTMMQCSVALAVWLSVSTPLLAQDSIIGTLDPTNEPRVPVVYDDGGSHEVSGPPSIDGEVSVITNGSQVIGQALEFGDTTLGRMFEVEGGELFLKGGRAGTVLVNNGHVEIENTELWNLRENLEDWSSGSLAAFGNSLVQLRDGSEIVSLQSFDGSLLSLSAFDNSRIEVHRGLVANSVFEDNSVLQLSGGQMRSVRLRGSSQFEMLGGELLSAVAVVFGDESHVTLHAGRISPQDDTSTGFYGLGRGTLAVGDVVTSVKGVFGVGLLFDLSDESTAEVTAGVHNVWGYDGSCLASLADSASLRITGGSFESVFDWEYINHSKRVSTFLAEDSSNLVIEGGDFQSFVTLSGRPDELAEAAFLDLRDDSTVTLRGGSFELRPRWGLDADFRAAIVADRAALQILGGEIAYFFRGRDPVIEVRDQASLIVTGSSFNYPIGTITDLEGELTGVLADGNAFRWNFIRGETATIRLVPEPSTALLLALAATFTVSSTRRRRN